MEQNISVRMAEFAFFRRNCNSAKKEGSAFNKLVYVVSVTDPHLSALAFRMASARSRSVGVVTLRFSSLPGVMMTFTP